MFKKKKKKKKINKTHYVTISEWKDIPSFVVLVSKEKKKQSWLQQTNDNQERKQSKLVF